MDAIRASGFFVNRTDQRKYLRICQFFAIRLATTLPSPIATLADIKHRTHLIKRINLVLFGYPGVLHRVSFAKYAATFFMISFSRLSRTFSARNRESSICSGVTTLAPAPLSLPAAAALTQLRSVCSIKPKSLATAPAVWPSLTRLTASSLNYAVYSCFGISFMIFLSK